MHMSVTQSVRLIAFLIKTKASCSQYFRDSITTTAYIGKYVNFLQSIVSPRKLIKGEGET